MSNTSWKRGGLPEDNIASPYVWDDEDEEVAELPAIGGEQAVRVLQEDSVVTLLEPTVSSDYGPDFGVFWITTENTSGRRLVGRDGSDPGAYSYMLFNPEEKVGLIIMGNGDDEIAEGFDETHDALIENLLKAAEVLGEL